MSYFLVDISQVSYPTRGIRANVPRVAVIEAFWRTGRKAGVVESQPSPIKRMSPGRYWSIEYSLNRDKGESTERPHNYKYSARRARNEVGQMLIKSRGRGLELCNGII